MYKRILDVFLSIIILIFFLPFMLLIAVLIKFMIGGSIFFRQKRAGLHGEPFIIFKFRTMKDLYDSNGQLLPDDKRITKFGNFLRKCSLDELPQLFNVLAGDMSLIGPRPFIIDYLPFYSKEQARRHEVKPGITGWAQVNGRNGISWEEKFKFDVWYVDHQSFWLDIKILFLTLVKVLKRSNVYNSEGTTMPHFMGK